MARILRYGNKRNDYIISFVLSNGERYIINNKRKYVKIENSVTFDWLKENAKKYTQIGSKRIFNKLWEEFRFKGDGLPYINESQTWSLESLKRRKFFRNGVYYVIL